ncbi:helix-turn-helix domain-containing protein [Mesobacillus thioparans]|uniref:helix-turn-helix domain-containing protein n=1 Tax=Mesobacillus thioparans TaxID=370439 RepID=UPI0039EE2381
MKIQIPRHDNIGEKIRSKRKEKGITLGELSQGICSVGKMSNIENGHIPVSEDDLKLICAKLQTSFSYFSDPNIEDKIQELDYHKKKINDLIILKEWKVALTELQNFKNKIIDYNIPSREVDYLFLRGVFYLNQKLLLQSEEWFHQVIEVKENNNYILRLKLRSHNALAKILFSNKKVSESKFHLERALEISKESPTVTKEERDNIFYNLSILYLYIGAYTNAMKSINSINHYIISPVETEYLKILIGFLENSSSSEVRKGLQLLRDKLQRMNDKEGMIRSWALTIFTLMTAYPNQELVVKIQDLFWADMELLSETGDLKETGIALLQQAMYVSIKKKVELPFIKKVLQKTKQLLPNTHNQLLHSRNYYLEGKLNKEILGDNSTALKLFKMSLQMLDANYNGLLKADILYEICKITPIQKEAINALELYHGHLESQFLFTHFHDLSLPPFKH